jgi:hypothetical protein
MFFGEDDDMLRTITQGSCVSIQGLFVRSLPSGRIVVRVGDLEYEGWPITAAA